MPRPYRVWGYPLVPAHFLLASVYLLGNYLVTEPRIFTVDVLVIICGIPIYAVWARRRPAV
jgi:APA family basic amino acid/polyamine antiporter